MVWLDDEVMESIVKSVFLG